MSRRNPNDRQEIRAAQWMDAYSEASAADSVEEAARILRGVSGGVNAETYNRAAEADSVQDAARILQQSSDRQNRSLDSYRAAGGPAPRGGESPPRSARTSASVVEVLSDGDRMATTVVGAAVGMALAWGLTTP